MKGFRWCPHCGSPHAIEALTCPATGETLETPGTRTDAQTKTAGILIEGRYRVGQRIGKGPSGTVYEAQELRHGWVCAVKIVRLPPGQTSEPKLARAKEDARALSAVGHPNISVITDLGTLPDGSMFFVSERLRGGSLKITPAGLPEDETRAIMVQILSALHAAHEAGVVHDNLKPANVYLARRPGCPPIVKVTDFGGHTARTPSYMAPEALQGRPTDRRADLWSAGIILYRMLTGKRPFEGNSVEDLLDEIDEQSPARPTMLRGRIANGWDSVTRRALERERKRRYPDALELLEALPTPASPDTDREMLPSLVSTPPSSHAVEIISDGITELHDGGPRSIPSMPSALPIVNPTTPSPISVPPAGRIPGDILGRVVANKYRLDALIGTGNAGAVYRAVHVDLDRTVAVKILHPHHLKDAEFVRRFKKEARVVSQIDHVNVTRVLDFGEEPGGLLYLVMEYVDGQSLEALIATAGRLAADRAISIGIQVCNALVAAHEIGVVHRDIKPDNILLVTRDPDETGPTDIVKVCDFGTAKMTQSGDMDATGVHMLFGSPAYMSPEQARCEELDQRSDLYSLGVTLYEALTGSLPILGADLAAHLEQAQKEPPRAPSELLPEIDPLLEDILLRLLAKNPAWRHATARELRAELHEVGAMVQVASSPVVVTLSKIPPAPT